MVVTYNALNRLETPKLILCNPGSVYDDDTKTISKVVGFLTDCEAEENVFNFNETSELNFRINYVPRKEEDSDIKAHIYKMYSSVQNRRLIFMDGIGYFMITGVTENKKGEQWYKDVRAESIDVEIQQKMIPYIPNDTYRFGGRGNDGGATGLIDEIARVLPLWNIEHVDESVSTRYRTFEDVDTSTNCLSFLLNDIQDAYECIVQFNIMTRTISVYDQANYSKKTGIFISNNDVINSLDIKEEADDLYTALSVFGGNDLNIAAVNPTGTNVIYNFDSFVRNDDWMSTGLKARVLEWKAAVEAAEDTYYRDNQSLFQLNDIRSTLQMEVDRLTTLQKIYQRCRDNIVASFSTTPISEYGELIRSNNGEEIVVVVLGYLSEGSFWKKRSGTYGSYSYETEIEKDSDKIYVDIPSSTVYNCDGSTYTVRQDTKYSYIVSDSSVQGATDENSIAGEIVGTRIEIEHIIDEYKNEITPIQSSINDLGANIDVQEAVVTGVCGNLNPESFFSSVKGYYSGSVFYGSKNIVNGATSYSDPITPCIGKIYEDKDTGYFYKLTSKDDVYYGYYHNNKFYEVKTFDANYIAQYSTELTKSTNGVYTDVDTGNVYLYNGSGFVANTLARQTNITNADYWEELYSYIYEGSYTDEYVIKTDIMSYEERFNQMKILYDRAKAQLAKVSVPTQEFTVNTENFIFEKEFEDFATEIETGCYINVEIDPNETALLFLTNLTINYDDHNMQMTFGNRYNRFDQKTLFDDLLGGIKRSANTLNYIKDTVYPIKNGEYNQMREDLKKSRNLTMQEALASENQEVVIDGCGYTGRQIQEGQSGEEDGYSDKQIKITNKSIVFTEDAWRSCKVAIGDIILENGSTYGVNAEVLIGDIIIGNELRILNDQGDELFTAVDNSVNMKMTSLNMYYYNDLDGEMYREMYETYDVDAVAPNPTYLDKVTGSVGTVYFDKHTGRRYKCVNSETTTVDGEQVNTSEYTCLDADMSIVTGYFYNNAFFEEDTYATQIAGQPGVIYIDNDTKACYRWSTDHFENVIQNVETTTGYTFNSDGLKIYESSSNIHNLLNNTGMFVADGDEIVLSASYNGVIARNLSAQGELSLSNDNNGNRLIITSTASGIYICANLS